MEAEHRHAAAKEKTKPKAKAKTLGNKEKKLAKLGSYMEDDFVDGRASKLHQVSASLEIWFGVRR
jgi:hypothetical protein